VCNVHYMHLKPWISYEVKVHKPIVVCDVQKGAENKMQLRSAQSFLKSRPHDNLINHVDVLELS
jgi:hypothetical protein